MANANFNDIEEFIDGFTKTDPYAETLYDGIIWGMEFTYGEFVLEVCVYKRNN